MMMRVLGALLLLLAAPALAQNQSRLEWYTVETDHFVVHYHAGTEATARHAAAIAESIYEPVTTFYDFEPEKKTHFILADYEGLRERVGLFLRRQTRGLGHQPRVRLARDDAMALERRDA